MNRQLVTSSTIHSLGYDKATKILEVEFKTGRIYQFFEVDDKIHKTLLNDTSIGTSFNKNIKNKFKYKIIV